MPCRSISWSSAQSRDKPSDTASRPGALRLGIERALGLLPTGDAAGEEAPAAPVLTQRGCGLLAYFLPVDAIEHDVAGLAQARPPIRHALGIAPDGAGDQVIGIAER